jgi:hypothetical protein
MTVIHSQRMSMDKSLRWLRRSDGQTMPLDSNPMCVHNG